MVFASADALKVQYPPGERPDTPRPARLGSAQVRVTTPHDEILSFRQAVNDAVPLLLIYSVKPECASRDVSGPLHCAAPPLLQHLQFFSLNVGAVRVPPRPAARPAARPTGCTICPGAIFPGMARRGVTCPCPASPNTVRTHTRAVNLNFLHEGNRVSSVPAGAPHETV